MPANPAKMMLGDRDNAQQLKLINEKYHFNKPLYVQYAYYLNDLSPISYHSNNPKKFAHYDKHIYGGIKIFDNENHIVLLKFPYLRSSYQKMGKPISEILKETFPNTAVLAIFSIIIAVALGIFLGIIACLLKDHWIDRLILFFSTIGMSIPSFFSAILFSWFFGYVLNSYTQLNMTGSFYELDDFGDSYHIVWKNLILPSLVLGIRPLAVIIQLIRNSLIETLSQDYIEQHFLRVSPSIKSFLSML